LVVMAAPAMARGSGGVVQIDRANDQLLVSDPRNPLLAEPKQVKLKADPAFPIDPIHPTDPINPNIVS